MPALRIVGAYRDTEVRSADPLGLLLADLAQARLVRRHQMGPLAGADATALLEDLLVDVTDADHSLVEGVVRRAGGTPFFLVSYAQALQQGCVDEVPWDLAQGVRHRAAVLPEAARLVLGAAAVVGRRAPRELLVAVVGQPEVAILAGLEAACAARLLQEEGDDAYSFAHDLIREVLEADLGAARRAMLHRQVAEALEGAPVPTSAELLAYHYVRAGIPDKAVRYLESAGDHAWSQRAHGAAEGHYREALERLERLGRLRDALRVREKLGDALYLAGRYAAALEVLERAAESYDAVGDLEGLARVTVAIGVAPVLVGTMFTSMARITALLDRLERGGASPPFLAALYGALGLRLFTANQYEAALAASERAATLARASGDARTVVLAERNRVNILQMLGRLGDALQVGETVLPLAETVGDLRRLVWLLTDLAYIHNLLGAFAPSRQYLDRALALAAQLGNPADLSFVLASHSRIAMLSGDWASAHADLDRATSASSQTDRSWFSSYPPIFQARLSLAQEEWTTATASAQEALDLAEGSGDLQALRWTATTMAEIDILEGRSEAARDRLVPLLDRPGLEECDVTVLLPVLAWAQLEMGQVDEAAETVAEALRRARPEGMRLVLVEALRLRSMVALRRGQWDMAAISLEEGLELARLMPYPYAEARLLYLAGIVHAEQRLPEVARERWEEALAIFTRLGARADVARMEGALHMLPGTP
ncbi:MAG TPA: hypothetical protein VFQ25_05945 [Ktedonobacterales bacterium]|nr:hypothetical protein [Ktedonobacterales bacterium]